MPWRSPLREAISSQTTSQPARQSPPSSSRWWRKKTWSLFGIVNVHRMAPTSSTTSSVRKAPKSSARLAAHEGQNPRLWTREGDQMLGAAFGAAHPGEAAVEDAAVEEAEDRALDAAVPEPVARLEVLLPAALDLVVAGVNEVVAEVARSGRAEESWGIVGEGGDLLPS